MKAIAAACLASLVALSGCLGESKPGSQDPNPAGDCIPGPACFDYLGVHLELVGCREMTFTMELAMPAFDLPPGFTPSNSPTSAQRLAVEWARCAQVFVPELGYEESDVSIGQVGVLVDPPHRGESEEASNVYDVEVVTDSAFLHSILSSADLPVLNATISLQDAAAVREATVTGSVSYHARAAIASAQQVNGVVYEDAHHSRTHLYRWERHCDINAGSGAAIVESADGALEDANASGALLGRGSQPVVCDIQVAVKQAQS